MKANETIVQGPAILMERRRKKRCWRIGNTSILFFIAHLQHYFTVKMWPSIAENSFRRIRYIDIDERDFCLVSYLFAAVGMSDDRITARGIFPKKDLPLWEDHIILHLCVQENNRDRFVPLRLEMKEK